MGAHLLVCVPSHSRRGLRCFHGAPWRSNRDHYFRRQKRRERQGPLTLCRLFRIEVDGLLCALRPAPSLASLRSCNTNAPHALVRQDMQAKMLHRAERGDDSGMDGARPATALLLTLLLIN